MKQSPHGVLLSPRRLVSGVKDMKRHSHRTFPNVLRVCGVFVFACFVSTNLRVQGQTAEFTQNHPGSHVVELQVPLADYPGRGTSLPVKLTYSSQGLWRLGFINSIQFGSVWRSATEAIYAEHSTAGWSTSLDVPTIEWPRQNDVYWSDGKAYTRGTVPGSTYRVAQLFIHMPNGATHEMRKQDAVYADTGVISMTGTFYAVDSSRMRYDSTGQNTGTLYLPDGTRYILGTSTVQRIDRNGNTLNYNVSTRQWIDTLGRVIGMPWPENPGPGDYTYSVPGLNNSTISYTIKFRSLSDSLTPGSGGLLVMADYYLNHIDQPPTGSNGTNFPQANSSSSLFHSGYSDPDPDHPASSSYTYVVGRNQGGFVQFNPSVLSEIVLPNGLSYKFSYNNYGELDKVIYPTGGYQRYQYAAVSAIGVFTDPYTQGSRGMISRWLSPNGTGGADESQWQYSTGFSPMTMTAPDGTVTETYLYYSMTNFDNQFGYQDARQGMVTEERVYTSQGGAMLRRSLYSYGVTTSVPTKPSGSGFYTAYRNARLEKEVSILLDTGGMALAKTDTYEYTDNGLQFSTGLDQTAATETHFQSIDQSTAQSGLITAIPPGTTATRLERVFLNNPTYASRYILGLPTSLILKGIVSGSVQRVAQTDFSYDESAYPLLSYDDLTGADYTDPGSSARGNVTTTTRYVDAAATIPLTTHSQYDQCGNLRNAWDERNIQSQTEYSATYKHAFATKVTTAIPDPSGQHGSIVPFISTSTFDSTGLVLTTTDANGQTTSYSYQTDEGPLDPLNRVRKITRPDGGWTKYSFGETLGNLFTLTETKRDATRTTQSYQYVDPLGRPSRTFESAGGTSYIAKDTIYDNQNRVSKVSNPYRTSTRDGVALESHTSDWTTSIYDSLDRTITVIYPDASEAHTTYEGIYTTLTDPAGKQTRQKSDALGRVVRVDEPNSSGSIGAFDSPTQATYYDYDTQGNLVHIMQGSNPVQHRYFKYDALGRLTYEHNVELAAAYTISDPVTGHSNWSRKLVYDETLTVAPNVTETFSGLLTHMHDARGIQTQFLYDKLNRVYETSYSDGTPTRTSKYDQPKDQPENTYFNKGRLTHALTAATASIPATEQIYNYDRLGHVTSHQQTVGTQAYLMTYEYNLAGALISQTYPSGRKVDYQFDDGGRLSEVSSGTTTYANQFDYESPTGILKAVAIGGNVESYVYNSRIQIQSVDLTRNGTQLQHYDYKYGVYDPATNTVDPSKNNNQIAQIEGFIATQKQWQQSFTYDNSARLKTAREFRGDNNQRSYLVNYDYDVFGNRYQKQTQNSDNPFPQVWVEDTQIDQNTNRFNTGVTYDAAGNVLVDSKFRNLKFEYDANNRQKESRNLDDSSPITSVFDAGGQRVATQVGGSLTNVMVYDVSGKLIAEYGPTGPTSGTQYIFNDPQGSPRVISNSQGVVSRHDYLPFGEELGSVGLRSTTPGYGAPNAARQKYAGMEFNENTNMSHTLWRQYDSYSARWTATDPYQGSMNLAEPQSFNRYSYVNNDPVNHVDSLGLMLSDMGIYQTNDPREASWLENRTLSAFRQEIGSAGGIGAAIAKRLMTVTFEQRGTLNILGREIPFYVAVEGLMMTPVSKEYQDKAIEVAKKGADTINNNVDKMLPDDIEAISLVNAIGAAGKVPFRGWFWVEGIEGLITGQIGIDIKTGVFLDWISNYDPHDWWDRIPHEGQHKLDSIRYPGGIPGDPTGEQGERRAIIRQLDIYRRVFPRPLGSPADPHERMLIGLIIKPHSR